MSSNKRKRNTGGSSSGGNSGASGGNSSSTGQSSSTSTGNAAPEYRKHDTPGDSSSDAQTRSETESDEVPDSESEKWQSVAEEMNFWSTFVETRLLGLGALMERLNAETTLASNAVKECGCDTAITAANLTRAATFPDTKKRCESKLAKTKEDLKKSEEGLSTMAIGLIVLGVMTAATVGMVLEKEL